MPGGSADAVLKALTPKAGKDKGRKRPTASVRVAKRKRAAATETAAGGSNDADPTDEEGAEEQGAHPAEIESGSADAGNNGGLQTKNRVCGNLNVAGTGLPCGHKFIKQVQTCPKCNMDSRGVWRQEQESKPYMDKDKAGKSVVDAVESAAIRSKGHFAAIVIFRDNRYMRGAIQERYFGSKHFEDMCSNSHNEAYATAISSLTLLLKVPEPADVSPHYKQLLGERLQGSWAMIRSNEVGAKLTSLNIGVEQLVEMSVAEVEGLVRQGVSADYVAAVKEMMEGAKKKAEEVVLAKAKV